MQWVDIFDIAIELYENEPELDPLTLSFVKLRQKILEIEGFKGLPEQCNEKILEGIQMAWYDEFKA